eukprot:5430018-Prymnesium_polylepis.1
MRTSSTDLSALRGASEDPNDFMHHQLTSGSHTPLPLRARQPRECPASPSRLPPCARGCYAGVSGLPQR